MATNSDMRDGVQAVPNDLSADAAVSRLMRQVGERVRASRKEKGMPRRVLSEISGVSPRYLAQLEAGEGNISIGLLQRIAMALDQRIDWLVREDEPAPADASRGQRICLIGLRGAGKSTLGALAGDALGIPFVELNSEIEAQAGMPVAEVIALYDQEGYRKLEARALDRIVATRETLVLAVAGGIVTEPETFKTLLGHFHTIWLKTSPEEHMSRVRQQGDERPMAGNPEAMEQLKSILTSREALYEQAPARLDTSGKTEGQSLTELLAIIEAQHFLTR
jgi:XRE family transcriptional regulator, aerobic/anaerobic benzoate catabolism transcriptional regulator